MPNGYWLLRAAFFCLSARCWHHTVTGFSMASNDADSDWLDNFSKRLAALLYYLKGVTLNMMMLLFQPQHASAGIFLHAYNLLLPDGIFKFQKNLSFSTFSCRYDDAFSGFVRDSMLAMTFTTR